MAYAAVLSLMQILQQIKAPGCHVLRETQQIEFLQEKVSFLHDFLENYSVCTDKVVKDLELKIRDAAYEAEDIIESYISTSILYDGGNSIGGFETFCRDLDRIIDQTYSIQQEAMDIKRMLELSYVYQRKTVSVDRSRLTFTDRTTPMVGFVEDSMKIKDWLTSSSSKLKVISIVGMGGIGKTTLARNVFDDALIIYHFDVRAWATVSQEYQMREILAGLLDSMVKLNTEVGKASCGDLGERLYKSLKGRTYLIVLDDIWDTKVWDEIKSFFPDDRNGSRIVLTSRLKYVGDHAASFDHLHDMSLLSSSESWNLFSEIVFRGECCPLSLMEIGRKIVKKCEGLPLSIVVIGGLLSMNKTIGYWETIATALKSVLATDGGQCSTIFSLSYNHLPPHLKPCFLYFALFPEDYVIGRSKLIKLWIAEGFIKPNESKSLEDIAKECLEDLSNRSLIMVLELGREGKVKTYKIHDLLRDFCITEAQKEKFLYVTNRYTTPSNPGGIRSEGCMFIQRFTPFKSSISRPPLPTRSILLYDSNADIIISDRRFGRLRVLDMGSGKTFREFPMELVRLVHLRYLSLRLGTTYFLEAIIPASISLIRGLQTLVLDIECCDLHLPLEVWTMTQLRHVRIRDGVHILNPPNSGVEGKNFFILVNLQTLSKIRNFRFTDEIIKRIPKLKKLKVSYDDLRNGDWSQFHLSNIVCLNELESLHIDSHIYPYSKIASPQYIKFPATLKKLSLSGWRHRWEDLTKMVGSLPNLEVLKLRDKACKGRMWEPNEGEFRELKFLELYNLDLVQWKANDSHFPKLKSLKIYQCLKLKKIPIEIGNIQTLEMIELDRESPSAVASAELILDEQRSFGNDVLQVHIKVPSRRRKDHLEPSLHEKKKKEGRLRYY